MLCHLMQNKLSSVGAELGKYRCKGVEMKELNDTEKFTSQGLLTLFPAGYFLSSSCAGMPPPPP